MSDAMEFTNGIPSNFYRKAPIVVFVPLLKRRLRFKTNEHYFHCDKAAHLYIHRAVKLEHYKAIFDAGTPKQAKELGRTLPMGTREIQEWDELHALTAMLTCNLAKFQQHEHCRQWLSKTGDRYLVEKARDPIWGDGLNGTGRNLLGHVLMLVRARVI